jgi:hypothetical protein
MFIYVILIIQNCHKLMTETSNLEYFSFDFG